MAKNTGWRVAKKRRVRELENKRLGGDKITAVYWRNGLITVNGETISIEEFERRYPDHKVVTWDDDDQAVNNGNCC